MTSSLRLLPVLALLLPAQAASAAEGTFGSFAGSWTGGGSLSREDGGSERLRCRVRYDVGDAGSSLAMHLLCASDAARLGVEASVRERGGSLSGVFTESSRGVSGEVSGTARDGRISARVSGLGFSATLRASADARRQEVAIVPDGPGTGVRAVSLVLTRR